MTASAPTRRRVSPVPPQHGAWAFLGLPLVVGALVAPWNPIVLLLAVTWIAAYPTSYFILAMARDRTSRRPDPGRFVRPLLAWSAVAVAGALLLLWARPWLLWVGAVYGLAFLVNIGFARRRQERSLLNDAVFIAECTAMVPVTWAVCVGEQSLLPPALMDAPSTLWILSLAVALVLTGSTLHVKSLIRERANPGFARVSISFAAGSVVASLALAAWWGLPTGLVLTVPFVYLLARSALLSPARTALRGAPAPIAIGMIELAGFVLLVIAAIVAIVAGA